GPWEFAESAWMFGGASSRDAAPILSTGDITVASSKPSETRDLRSKPSCRRIAADRIWGTTFTFLCRLGSSTKLRRLILARFCSRATPGTDLMNTLRIGHRIVCRHFTKDFGRPSWGVFATWRP